MPGNMFRILIVDDDHDIRANLSDILMDIGYETDTAACGQDAIAKIENCLVGDTLYDLCLLDFKMPGMDGVQLYEEILVRSPGLKAIMITAFAGEDGIQRAKDAGTWKVLKKPIDIPELLTIISDAQG